MKKFFTIAGIALVVAVVMDFIWIGFIAKTFYIAEYGSYYSPHPVWIAAILFYVIYVLGMTHFVIMPGVSKNQPLLTVTLNGAFLALVAFGTYDLTSLAVTLNWPVLLCVVDMTWGVFEGAVIAGVTFFIVKKYCKWIW